MSYKFCPFSFFTFYVNKSAAQAGGAHHCVEEACALWDAQLEQCSLKTACESISGGSFSPSSAPKQPAPVSSVLDKIRKKKMAGPSKEPTTDTKPQEVTKSAEKTTTETANRPATDSSTTKEPSKSQEPPKSQEPSKLQSAESNPTPERTTAENQKSEPVPEKSKDSSENQESKPDPDYSDLLNPPKIDPKSLPVISVTPEDSGKTSNQDKPSNDSKEEK